MGNQIEIAKHRLFGDGGIDAGEFKIYPGTLRDITPEQIAEQINKSLSHIESGDFDDLNDCED
jgi:hypothetical protein